MIIVSLLMHMPNGEDTQSKSGHRKDKVPPVDILFKLCIRVMQTIPFWDIFVIVHEALVNVLAAVTRVLEL